ncbi:uncharacterized protein [Battus philenor]|uniref:uncharacterized protein n=1 Tax=Battus philenor TaxID=42288 RepID=UPI0035D082E3
MEEEVEVIGDEVNNADSKKSVTTSNVYSADFTDCTSDINNSFSKETYVIDWDDSEDSESSCRLVRELSTVNLTDEASFSVDSNDNKMTCVKACRKSNRTTKIPQTCTLVAQEIFTQTSKTIMELAETDGLVVKSTDLKTLQTQTSYVSITENKTIEYKIFSSSAVCNNNDGKWLSLGESKDTCSSVISKSLEDKSSKLHESSSDAEKIESSRSEVSSEREEMIVVDRKQILSCSEPEENLETTLSCSSDIDDDSLLEPKCNKLEVNSFKSQNSDVSFTQNSINTEVEDLYDKVSNFFNGYQDNLKTGAQADSQWARALTPLTEESTVKKESIIDMSPCLELVAEIKNKDEAVKKQDSCSIEQNQGVEVGRITPKKKKPFKLPPIHNNKSASLNFLLSANHGNVSDNHFSKNRHISGWELKTSDMASGEHLLINKMNRVPADPLQLPPIHLEGGVHNLYTNRSGYYSSSSGFNISPRSQCDSINIQDKIKELKMSDRKMKTIRNVSPSNTSSPDWSKLCDASQKGMEVLCGELLRKLKSSSWCEVVDTLEELPKVMEKFWNVITELRTADLIRQVTVHVDSPRTQVARTACLTLASILKNTNYTRKPDFYEAVTTLLVKTGSACRPVRRAANMALDEVVCSVDFTHAVTALCVHGVGHKSPLVRCAAARLLVVCCAVSGGGRGLLRSRPPSAASARRAALRALADLLRDKATDARKYAERLYAMLRPLTNFEAYFITDVDVELASSQMKKYDPLLLAARDR